MSVIHAESFNGSSLPSGWLASTGSTWGMVGTTDGVSPPPGNSYMLQGSVPSSGRITYSYTTADSNGGNVTVSCALNFYSTDIPGYTGVFARAAIGGSGATPTVGYFGRINWNTGEVSITLLQSGGMSVLASAIPVVGIVPWDILYLTASGSTLSLAVQQSSTGLWLSTGGGAWQSSPVSVLSVGDTTLPGSGVSGVYAEPHTEAFPAFFGQWQLATAGLPASTTEHDVSVSSGLGLRPSAFGPRTSTHSVSAGFVVHPAATSQKVITLSVSAGMNLSPSPAQGRAASVSVSAGLGLSPTAVVFSPKVLHVSAGLGLSPTASGPRDIAKSVSSGLGVADHPAVTSPKILSVSAGLGVGTVPFVTSPRLLSLGDTLEMVDVVGGYGLPILLSVASTIHLTPQANPGVQQHVSLSVSSTFNVEPDAALATQRTYNLSVSSGLGLQPAAATRGIRTLRLSVSAGFGLAPSAVARGMRTYNLSVSAGLGISPALSLSGLRTYRLSVSAGFGLSAAVDVNTVRSLTVSVGLGLRPVAATSAARSLHVATGLGLSAATTAPRTITLSVSAGLGLSAGDSIAGLHGCSIAAGLGLHATASAIVGTLGVSDRLGFLAIVSCKIEPPGGVGVPGVSNDGGPSMLLYSGLSGRYPFTFAETPSGPVLAANGHDPMVRWDPLAASADVAGLAAPISAPTGVASGLGRITGERRLFVRYVDQYGNPSNLSPAGVVQCGFDRSIDDIALSGSGTATILSRDHGLTTGQAVILEGINGLPLDGMQTVTVIDSDRFWLPGVSLSRGTWTGGGTIIAGSSTISWSGIPQPSQWRVAQIQLLRNLEGTMDALYVVASVPPGTTDVIDGLADDQLALCPAVALRSDDGTPLAMRYGQPPANRPLLCTFQGRVFAAGDLEITGGNAQVSCNSNVIKGWGTQWPESAAGRLIYVQGASRSYAISSVDTSAQALTVIPAYSGSPSLFVNYSIRSSPADRKTIQWSEPDNPEAWPAWNALAVPEDNDEITGLFVRGTYLYIAEKRHIYRFQFSGDPGRTGHLFLQASRGAINQRVIADVGDAVFVLDEVGIYKFDGSGAEPVDGDVLAIWWDDGMTPTYQIDWTADQTLWHASVDPVRTIVRWFVSVVGVRGLTTCLCYNYRLDRWWWEQYPVGVTSSATGTLAGSPGVVGRRGRRRPLAGSECRVVMALGHGSLDLAADSGTLRGTVTSATAASITDTTASFAPYLGGAPLTIVSGSPAAGQTRIISASSGDTLTTVQAWDITPAPGDVYQVGGIPWEWRGGWLDVEDEEGDTTRDLALAFAPMTNPVTMDARLYFDHSDTPMNWGYPQSIDGVSVAEGQPHIRYDLTSADVVPGYRVFRMARHSERYAYSDRYVQVHLSGVQHNETVQVYQVSLRGVDQEGV